MKIIITLAFIIGMIVGIYSCAPVTGTAQPETQEPPGAEYDPLLRRSEPFGGKYSPLYDPLKEEEIESEECPLETEELESPPLFNFHKHEDQNQSQ